MPLNEIDCSSVPKATNGFELRACEDGEFVEYVKNKRGHKELFVRGTSDGASNITTSSGVRSTAVHSRKAGDSMVDFRNDAAQKMTELGGERGTRIAKQEDFE